EILEEKNPVKPNLNYQLNSTLSTDYQSLLQSGKHSDLLLLVGGKEFAVHKAILAARSSVFERMLDHDTRENQEGIVEITDIDKDVCEQMLRYIYTDNVDSIIDQYGAELLAAADKVRSPVFWML